MKRHGFGLIFLRMGRMSERIHGFPFPLALRSDRNHGAGDG